MSLCLSIGIAFLLDAAFGWPNGLYARLRHPVVWAGGGITFLEQRWNRDTRPPIHRRCLGVCLVVGLVGLAVCVSAAIVAVAPSGWLQTLLVGVLMWPLLAARGLYDHVAAVAKPLGDHDITAARSAVSHIVGRDPQSLDASGVARAALESLAENTSDGVVAPVFWGLVAGLPGMAAYKVVNTLDSMVGHRTPRYAAFGWAAARLDDVMNFIPARLTGLLFAVVTPIPREVMRCQWRDACQHRSPNAGWPEAGMARALGVRLSGPRQYAGVATDEPWLNGEGADPVASDVRAGLQLYVRAMVVLGGGVLVLASAAGVLGI